MGCLCYEQPRGFGLSAYQKRRMIDPFDLKTDMECSSSKTEVKETLDEIDETRSE